MILVTVTYPVGAKFDVDYYLSKHMQLLRDRWTAHGLKDARVIKGLGKADGGAPDYQMAALLTFESLDAFKAAGKAHGKEIFADISRFTDANASVQINEVLS